MNKPTTKQIVLGGGCFWCIDAPYRMVRGVRKSEVGYSGGESENPSYEEVSSGSSGHVEVVRLTFEPEVINLEQILEVFWILHDPTSRDAQGADVGSQYASVIFYTEADQLAVIEKSKAKVQSLFKRPIVTEIKALNKFFIAEDYHQDYFNKNPAAGYCQAVINPKLVKLRQNFSKLIDN